MAEFGFLGVIIAKRVTVPLRWGPPAKRSLTRLRLTFRILGSRELSINTRNTILAGFDNIYELGR
jgi:hypothetical protein